MKRSNIFRIMSLMMVVMMLTVCSITNVSAATAVPDAINPTVHVTVDVTGIQLYGSFEYIVLYPGVTWSAYEAAIDGGGTTNIKASVATAGQFIVEALPASNTVAFDITLSETDPVGTYTLYVGQASGSEPQQIATFFFASMNTKLTILDQLKLAAADPTDPEGAIGAVLKANSSEAFGALGISEVDYDRLSAGAKQAFLKNLKDSPSINNAQNTPAGLVDAIDVIKAASLAQLLNDNKIGTAAELDTYKDAMDLDVLFGIYDGTTSLGAKISPAGRTKLLAIMSGRGFADADAMRAEFANQVLIIGVTGAATPADAVAFIDKVGTTCGFTYMSLWNGANLTKKTNAVVAAMKAEPTTVVALNEVMLPPLQAADPQGPGQGSSGSGSGSGSGGTITVPQPDPEKNYYNDIDSVTKYPWAKQAVEALTDSGAIDGIAPGIFAPAETVTREQFTKIAVVGRYGPVDMSAVPSFEDAQDGWFAPFVAAGESRGIIKGIGYNLFGIGLQITRQDIAVIMARIIEERGMELNTTPVGFADSDLVSGYAVDAVNALANVRIVIGNDGSFAPFSNATRAEAAVMIYRTLQYIGFME